MREIVICDIVTSGMSLIVCLVTNMLSNRAHAIRVDCKLETLTDEVREHNKVIDRVFLLERKTDVTNEKLTNLCNQFNAEKK